MKIHLTSLNLALALPGAFGKIGRSSAEDKLAKVQQEKGRHDNRRLNPEYSCFGDHDFTLYFKGECNYDNLVDRMHIKTEENSRCINSGAEEIQLLVGVIDPSDVDIAKERVKTICKTAMDAMAIDPTKSVPWEQVTNKGHNFDEQYYDGKTFFNEERQTDYDSLIPGEVNNELKRDGERIDDLYETVLERVPFQWPYHIDNFENCEIRAAMCCWVQDRQANDNNGNCNTPYDENCIDKDPADNTEICAVDMSREPNATFADDGIMIFRGDDEGDTHCHGMAWGTNSMEADARYKGNNLFYISQYDHLYQRGYVTNVPGAPMCGCVEKMPIVTRADCTEIDEVEYWKFDWNAVSAEFTAYLDRAEIEFNACQGAGKNNDLEAFYQRLYNEGRASWDDREKLRRTIVGDENCHTGTDSMVFDAQGFEEYYPPIGLNSDEGQLYSIRIYDGTDEGKDYLYTDTSGDVSLVDSAENDRAKWRLIPKNDEGSLFNLRPNPENEDLPSHLTYLKADYNGNVHMTDIDAKKGNELWSFHKYPGTENVYNIFIGGNTRLEDRYLSTNPAGNPDLYHKDDASGRQRWVVELLDDTFDTDIDEIEPQGVVVKYYDVTLSVLPSGGLDTLTPYAIDHVTNIDFNAGSGSVLNSGKSDNIAIQFDGQIDFSENPGTYSLCVGSDDGSKLYLDDELVVDNDGLHGYGKICSSIYLDSLKSVKVDFFERGGSARCDMLWTPPGSTTETVVPAISFI